VDPKRAGPGILLAPPHPGYAVAARLPAARTFPPLDEPIVRPETREEMVRGRLLQAMPALPAHADQHFTLDYVLGAHVKPGYVGSTDLLTREAARSNFATDTCIRKKGDDPRTGERYLEELSFEVVNEQSREDVTEKAQDLVARGVRRVVAIFVKKGEVHEWSSRKGAWKQLDLDDSLHDPVLVTPLPLRELLQAAEADDAVARALLAKNNRVLVAARTESREEGRRDGLADGRRDGLADGRRDGLADGQKQGLRRGLEAVCELLGLELGEERRAFLETLDTAGLDALLTRLRVERRWPE
jgi:Putative restriction endonuclease